MTQANLRGKYRIVRLLGEGGMGSVYEAEDTTSGAHVALKVMRAEITKSGVYMARFDREVRASQASRTPYIVEVIEAGTDAASGEPYMAMELLEGEDVKQLIRRLGPLPPDLALKIVAQACIGLAAAHEQRIVHRDIKSANLFLAKKPGGERVVKLLDFGIAKEKFDHGNHMETAGLTRTGNMLGSPLYMSPEQVRGHKTIDHRADLWSLGIVLYEALTSRTPHQDVETLGELIITICSELPRPVQEVAPWVAPELAMLLHGVIRFDPAERFESAAVMFEAMRPMLGASLTITEDMLRPLSAAERAYVAPRLPEQAPQGLQSMQASIPGRGSSSGPGRSTGSMAPGDMWRMDSSSWPGAPPPGAHPQGAFPHGAPPPGAFPHGAPPPGAFPPGTPSHSPSYAPAPAAYGAAHTGSGMTGSGLYAIPIPPAPWHADPSAPAPTVSGTTFSPTSDSVRIAAQEVAPPSRSSRAPVIAAAAGLVFAGAVTFIGYKFLRPEPAAPEIAAAPTSTAAAPTVPANAEGSTAPKQGPLVRLKIVPPEASVWIDGDPVTPSDGYVDIKGDPGTVRRVRVVAGGAPKEEDVAVTLNGAVPSQIEALKGYKPYAPGQAAGKPTASAKPGPAPGSDLRTQR